MCNYYSRHREPRNLQGAFKFPELPNMEPRYLVRPTNLESVVAIGKDGGRHLVPMRWGLVPPWAKDLKTGLTLFNARSESILDKRTFAVPFAKGRRCLVPVDGFFEFTGPKGAKQPIYFRPRDGRIMAFAGLWESWRGSKEEPLEEPLLSYTIATAAANATVAPYHDRMPVLFTRAEEFDAWLDQKAAPERVAKLLVPAPDDLLEAHAVTRELLKIKQPGPEVLKAVA